MRKFNIIYLAIIPVLAGIFYINWNYARHTILFYGFAENKETEINHEHPVLVNKIYVTPGQFVNKGDLLLEATHSKFDLKMNELSHEIESMQLRVQERKADIQRSIRQLETEWETATSEIELNIKKLQSEISLNQSLLKDLKSIEQQEPSGSPSPSEVRLANLQQEKALTAQNYSLKIRLLKDELASINAPQEVQMEMLKNEKSFYLDEQKKNGHQSA